MKIYILVENSAGPGFGAEHGISYLIESDEKNILFDTGHTDLFIKNANLLGFDLLDKIDTIVISHGHWDHINGLSFLVRKLKSERKDKKKISLYAHPGIFKKRYHKGSDKNLGSRINQEELADIFDLVLTDIPVEIIKNIYFLGKIPRITGFEAQSTPYVFEDHSPDYLLDDSGLLIIIEDKLILISGCAHSGICNMTEYAKNVSGFKDFLAILGGFHLKTYNAQAIETVNYLKRQSITRLFPSHCTRLPVVIKMGQHLNVEPVLTGMVLEF